MCVCVNFNSFKKIQLRDPAKEKTFYSRDPFLRERHDLEETH